LTYNLQLVKLPSEDSEHTIATAKTRTETTQNTLVTAQQRTKYTQHPSNYIQNMLQKQCRVKI